MDKKELEIIKELMDQLAGEMEYGEDDFVERLGRKPKVNQVKIDIEKELPLEEDEDMMFDDESDDESQMDMDLEEVSPEDELKKRLMSLRGR